MPRWMRRLEPAVTLAAVLLAASGALAQDAPPPAAPAPAQQAPPPVPADFESPAATLATFLRSMAEPPDFDKAVACLDLSDVPRESARDRAIKLSGILNRIAETRGWHHPSAADLASGRSLPGVDNGRYLLFPRYPGQLDADTGDYRIVIERTADGWWKFSAETVAGLDDLYNRVRDLPVLAGLGDERELSFALWLESRLPKSLVINSFLTLRYWQWLALFAIVLVGVMLDFSVRIAIRLISQRVIAAKGGEASRETIRRTVRPFGVAATALLWLWAVRLLDLPAEALQLLLLAARFFAMLAMVWAGFRLTDLVGEVLVGKAARTETRFDDVLVPLLRKTVKIFIFVFGLIYIADSLDVEIAPLLAGLGIGGIGFAFAARDTLENFFGSITVIVDRPFHVGDWVVIGDVEGTVETLGMRSSRIRTFYNSLVTVPNGNLVRANVDNYGQRKYRRWKTHIAVTYDTPPDKIDAFTEGIRELIRVHPYTRKDFYAVWMHQFGASSLDVLVYMFFETPDWSTELRERHRLILDIIRLANRLGVHFAFPTETVHLYQESREVTDEPAPPPAREQDRRSLDEGRRAVREITAAADWRTRRPEPYVFRPAPEDDDDTQIESTRGGDAR